MGTLIYQVGDELREVLKSRRKHKVRNKSDSYTDMVIFSYYDCVDGFIV